jgi:molybdopterin-guanine dinucleotide biosynthesis protein A
MAGLVLAGGESSRFGRDKASALLLGRPMLDWVCNALAAVCGRVIVVAPSVRGLPAVSVPFERLDDAFPGEGPLGGLVSGFRGLGSGTALAVGCDMPLLEPPDLEAIVAALESNDAAWPEVAGRSQPLAAAYDVARCLPNAEALFAAGERRLLAARDVLLIREVLISPAREMAFRSINTRADLAAAERWLSGQQEAPIRARG